MSTYDTCDEEVSRGGILQPCEKTAVALRMDPEYRQSYPVCAFHARGEMVPLAEIMRANTNRSEPQHDASCAEWCNHCEVCGVGILYGSRCPEHPNRTIRHEVDEFAPGECDGSRTCSAPVHVHGCYKPHRSDQCDSPDEYGHIDRTIRCEECGDWLAVPPGDGPWIERHEDGSHTHDPRTAWMADRTIGASEEGTR